MRILATFDITLYYRAFGPKDVVIDVRTVGVQPLHSTVGLLISK